MIKLSNWLYTAVLLFLGLITFTSLCAIYMTEHQRSTKAAATREVVPDTIVNLEFQRGTTHGD